MPSSHALQPITPARPLAPYIGGKRNLSARLVELIDATPCALYAEPFVGMGGVFLRRRRRPKCEVINDLSGDVANLFRIARRHPEALERELQFAFTSRAEFERQQRVDPATLTDVERAARFLQLQRTAFGGKVTGRNYGVRRTGGGYLDTAKLFPILRSVHSRLSAVHIEQLPWAEFIRRYDTPGTLFYLDPPYFGSEGDYGAALFGRGQFEHLADALSGLQGRFLLSINDTPEIRALFGRFSWREVATTYGLAAAGQQTGVRELIIGTPGLV